MLQQILLGGAVTAINIVIQASAMLGVIAVDRHPGFERLLGPFWMLAVRMIGVVAVLNLAHMAQIIVWAVAYRLFDVVPPGTDSLYFAFVNFATLGYGDIVPSKDWRLIGPATAINGVLMLGWSTAVMMSILSRHEWAFPGPRGDR